MSHPQLAQAVRQLDDRLRSSNRVLTHRVRGALASQVDALPADATALPLSAALLCDLAEALHYWEEDIRTDERGKASRRAARGQRF